MNELPRYQKILLIIGFFLFIIVCGYALYYVFLRPSTVTFPSDKTSTGTSTGKLPLTNDGKGQIITSTTTTTLPADNQNENIYDQNDEKTDIDKVAKGNITEVADLTNTPSQGVTLSGDGKNVQYYDKSDGKFYRIDKDGNISALSDKTFFSVDKITWSPDKNKAVLEYPDQAKVIYDFSTGKQTTIPSHWKDFSFSNDGKQLAIKSMGSDPDNRWLAVVGTDGSSAKKIEPLGDEDSTVYPLWSPSNQVVALFTQGVDLDRQEVYFIGQNNENFKSTIIPGRGFQPKWSPKGDKLFYSVYSTDNDLKPMLWLVNADGDNIGSGRKKIGLETWAEKCTFADEKTAYCAVPKELPEASGLFPEIASDTEDNLYKIDIYTGSKKLVAIPDGKFNISDVVVNKDGDSLYFTDRATRSIHKINLK